MSSKSLAQYIDHTLLKQDSTKAEIITLCKEAEKYNFAAVCVNPHYVQLAVERLQHTKVKVATVVGFPLGSTTTFTKVAETRDAIANGATEIDMVMNVSALKSNELTIVSEDIRQVVLAAENSALVKVIIETGSLSVEEKRLACELVKKAGADFVKTSTGFGHGGATVEDIKLMREIVGEMMGVKASGGIRDSETAIAMIEAGATRIGASASVQIVSKISKGSPF